MPTARAILHLLRDLRTKRDESIPLQALADEGGWSPFQLHRAFSRVVGETPKQYTLRLRLERAASRLTTTDDSVVDIALDAGFNSHEVFTRAFRRQFNSTPTDYRAEALGGASRAVRVAHAALTDAIGPCVGLFGLSTDETVRRVEMPLLSIAKKEIPEQPILFVRRRVGRHEITAALGECFGMVFGFCMKNGLPIAGRPTARYISGPGLIVIDAGVALAAPATGEGEIQAGALPGGPVALGIHGGPYDQLPATYAAMERWCEENGLKVGTSWWESYVTDPAEHPDPADWRTEVFAPLVA